MTLQEEYELSCYRVLDRLWDDKEVYLVRHVETGKLFIKKQIDLYNQRVYEHLGRLDILDADSLDGLIQAFESNDLKQLHLPEVEIRISAPAAIVIPVAIYV